MGKFDNRGPGKPTEATLKERVLESLDRCGVAVLPPMDVRRSISLVGNFGLPVACTILDPWYNKGVGGVRPDYDEFISTILSEVGFFSSHIYLWGFPEIVARFVDRGPSGFHLTAWLTWYYKNNPSVIRGWRSSQMACLHFSVDGSRLYPEHFLNAAQREKLAQGKLRYMPGPTSVIEAPLLVGFVGRGEQTGHPAQKPESVFEKLILMTTKENDLVFDPMCGSGTTGKVVQKLGRRAILCDHSEEYTIITERRVGVKRISIT